MVQIIGIPSHVAPQPCIPKRDNLNRRGTTRLGGRVIGVPRVGVTGMPVRVVGLIVVAVVASLVAAQSDTGSTFFRFLKESDIERRKVVWPTHQETLQTALMVIIVTILISLFLAAVDWILGAVVRSLVGG